MKKLLTSLCLLLVVSGCSNAYTKVKNPGDAIITINDKVYVTKGDMYESLFTLDSVSSTLEVALNKILELEVPVTEEDKKNANENLKTYKELGEETFNSYLMYYGFYDEETLLNSLIRQEQQKNLVKNYVNTKFDELAGTYKPTKARVLCFADEEVAKEALEKVKNGAAFEDVATELGATTYKGSEDTYTTDSSLDRNPLTAITTTTLSKLYESVITGSDNKYYIVEITNADPSTFTDDASSAMAGASDILMIVMRNYLKQYDFKIYDKDLYDAMKSAYPDFIFD